jgi:hypothetical protein
MGERMLEHLRRVQLFLLGQVVHIRKIIVVYFMIIQMIGLGLQHASPSYKLHIKTASSGRTDHDQRIK